MGPHAVKIKSRLTSGIRREDFRDNYTKTEALKEQGNNHFKRKHLKQALKCYSEAVFHSPWPCSKIQTILSQLLGCLEPPKNKVATNLFANEQKRTNDMMSCGNVVPSQTSLLAVCIGNRSAVLYEMNRPQECLADIELALSLDFPLTSEHKLYRRRACCLAQLGNRAGAVEALETCKRKLVTGTMYSELKREKLLKETVSYHKIVERLLQDSQEQPLYEGREQPSRLNCSGEIFSSHYVSRSVVCDSCPSKERFLKAVKPIDAGEVVMCEDSYASVLNYDLHLTHCSYCLHKTSALIPCCWCTSDGYCSSRCREKAWIEYHWLECLISDLWSKADWMMRLALRIIVSTPVHVLKGALSRDLDESELYAAIWSLVSHKDQHSDTKQMNMFSKMADMMIECFGDVIRTYILDTNQQHKDTLPSLNHPDRNQRLESDLRNLFLHHLLQLRCNSHSITTVMKDSEEGDDVVQASHEVQIGSVIFPTASLFNHSCWPNIIFRFVGRSVVAVATMPIGKGEEMNNCYGPQVGRMKRLERMTELKRKYFFICSCPACGQSDASLKYQDMVVDAYLCTECGGAVIERDSDAMAKWQCYDCHLSLEKEQIERFQELVSETERMYSTAQEGGINLPLLLKCHTLQSRVLHQHNMQLARTTDTVAHVYASSGDFVKAAEFCSVGCRAVEAVYGSHSIELATELHKLAQLLYNCEQFSKAVGVIERALPLLRVYYPPYYTDIIELQNMMDQLKATKCNY